MGREGKPIYSTLEGVPVEGRSNSCVHLKRDHFYSHVDVQGKGKKEDWLWLLPSAPGKKGSLSMLHFLRQNKGGNV